MTIIECYVDPRVLDLGEKLEVVFMEWAETNLASGEQFDIIIMPDDINIGHHRMRITGGDGGGGGGIILKLGEAQAAPERIQ